MCVCIWFYIFLCVSGCIIGIVEPKTSCYTFGQSTTNAINMLNAILRQRQLNQELENSENKRLSDAVHWFCNLYFPHLYKIKISENCSLSLHKSPLLQMNHVCEYLNSYKEMWLVPGKDVTTSHCWSSTQYNCLVMPVR